MSLILLLVLGILFSQPSLLPAILLFLVLGVAGPSASGPAAVPVRPEAVSCDSADKACAMLQAGRAAGPEAPSVAEPGTP